MVKLITRSVRFSERDLTAWRDKDRSLLDGCSELLRRILCDKAEARPGRRFLGYAYVAAREFHDEGWYGSFKWLTAPKWSGEQKLPDSYQEAFRDALQRHFPTLREFQRICVAATGNQTEQKPVGPDLWLTTPDRHRFIEVKLPGDHLARHQLVGLALIATFLKSDRPVCVEVVTLDSGDPRQSGPLMQEFGAI
jgi:hypothetical protein